ncbi:MAG: bifunctional diaminohydroxyphosphoribosylaminopyrimidine deaminase/5-amino-6-(5-phosphoribosylamino)uracil reductase RibD [Tepidisphaeraceae bacterium]|jgi:diaminohydroxyphosphoribosylaminopyrimidine deaminase/5-amino-6-(5-phosphoribosylamino)uracil reductase
MDREMDIGFMRRALELARQGRGTVEPNPMVGCVIVQNGVAIGEGFHQQPGGPHAEPIALQNCTSDPAGATAYVNLEPCCHLSKRTPPCVPRLIAAKIARVVVGCRDPNPLVSGRGIDALRAAGIAVDENILGDEAKQLDATFFKHIEQRRPYVTLKWAQSANGKVATIGGERLIISNRASLSAMHRLRGLMDAIMVGINTVLADDPLLTVRDVPALKNPLRVILDTHLRIPLESRILRSAEEFPVLIYCSHTAVNPRLLDMRGVEVVPVVTDAHGHVSLAQVLNDLGGRNVTHVMVEPGPILAAAFLRDNLADRAWIFESSKNVPEKSARDAIDLQFVTVGEADFEADRFSERLNPKSECFFSAVNSADFIICSTLDRLNK